MSLFNRPNAPAGQEIASQINLPQTEGVGPNSGVAFCEDSSQPVASETDAPGVLQKARNNWRKLAFAGGLTVAAIAGAEYVNHNGLPDPKNVDITEVGRGFINASEEAAPYLLGLAGVQVSSMAFTRGGRKTLKMAYRGLHASSSEQSHYKTLVKGALLPTIGIAALSTAFMIEDGIHTGANKNISSMVASLEDEYPEQEIIWTLQKGTNHFMNDSALSPQIFQAVNTSGQVQEGNVVAAPFWRDLVTIPTPFSDNQAAMIISVDGSSPVLPNVKDGAICDQTAEQGVCDLKADEIILDEGEGFNVGDNVEIRGHDFTVVGFPEEDQSLVNRLIAFTGVSEETISPKDQYGFVTLVDKEEDAVQMIEDLGLKEQVDVLSTEGFLGNNEDFWSHNGTPLLILMIGDIAILAGVTFSSMKKFEQERDQPVLATLRAIGASKGQVAQQQFARTSVQTAKGLVPGFAVAEVSTLAINKLLPGFSGDVTPKMVLAATAVTLGVQMASTAKGLLSNRKVGLAQQMKAN